MSRACQQVAALNLAECVWMACILEATARKPGNVHPEASFVDLSYGDFVASARLIAPILAQAKDIGLGRSVLSAIQKTRSHAPRNSNLGIVLLIAPLAAVPLDEPLADGLPRVLNGLTRLDADEVYEAIRIAWPGGLGDAPAQDVAGRPNVTLREAMRLAADRDTVAAQYANGYRAVFEIGLPLLESAVDFSHRWERAIVELHLRLMSDIPDTLIARKCGPEMAVAAANRARAVLDSGWPDTENGLELFDDLDKWLRADGNRRNPGTTADLVAACLFAAFRERRLAVPDFAQFAGLDSRLGQLQ